MYLRFLFIVFLSGSLAAQTKEAELERSTYAEGIFKEKDAAKKRGIYESWMEKFPPGNFPHSLTLYDFARIEIAKAYILEGRPAEAIKFSDPILVEKFRAELWRDLGETFLQKGYNAEAEDFLLKAWNLAYQYVQKNDTDEISVAIASRFPAYSFSLSQFYRDTGKKDKAVQYLKPAFEYTKGKDQDVNLFYMRALRENGDDSIGIRTGEALVMAGAIDHELRLELAGLLYRKYGQDSTNAIFARLFPIVDKYRKEALRKQIVDLPAPPFTLTDLRGKKVSLSDYRGKTVVLDFWATWCIPCIESFPWIQMVVKHFKTDSTVKFLFIHTWEKTKDDPKNVKKFMKNSPFDFHVLMDLKDPVTEINNVVEAYNVEALPAKIIIDKNGRIRFIKVANWEKERSDGNAKEELAAMIELVKELQ
jgi:peroxiredoxin